MVSQTTPTADVSLPDGPRSRVRSTLRVMRDPLKTFREMFARYGDPCLFPALNGQIVMTADPEIAQEILTASPEIYDPFAAGALHALLGDYSLLTLRGEEHRRQRKLIMPAFHGNRMRAYAQVIADVTDRHLDALKVGEVFSVAEMMTNLTQEVIVRAVFGFEDAEQVAHVCHSLDETVRSLKPVFAFSPALQVAPFGLGPWGAFLRKLGQSEQLLFDQIARTREKDGGEYILSMLLEARDEQGEGMSDRELRDELITLLVAGHETSANVLAWTMYHLHDRPETMEPLRDEIKAHGDEDLSRIPRLPYTKSLTQEALRLFPVLPDIGRLLLEPFPIKGGRYHVPAGYNLGIAISMMHHDPANYADPMTFDPARFLDESPPKWAYFPFGGGHRRCVGAAFASFEIGIVLARLTSRARFESQEPTGLYPKRRNIIMAPPTPIHMKLVERA